MSTNTVEEQRRMDNNLPRVIWPRRGLNPDGSGTFDETFREAINQISFNHTDLQIVSMPDDEWDALWAFTLKRIADGRAAADATAAAYRDAVRELKPAADDAHAAAVAAYEVAEGDRAVLMSVLGDLFMDVVATRAAVLAHVSHLGGSDQYTPYETANDRDRARLFADAMEKAMVIRATRAYTDTLTDIGENADGEATASTKRGASR